MTLNNIKGQKTLFCLITILYWIAMYIYVPILSPFLNDLSYSLTFIGIVLGSYGFVQIIVRFPIGILSDLYKKRKLFVSIGMLCAFLSCILFLFSDFWIFPLLARIVAGVCASTWVAFIILYTSYFAEHETAKAMGQISILIVVGQLIGMVLSGFLSELGQGYTPFIAGSCIAAIGFFLSLLLKEDKQKVSRQHRMSLSLTKDVFKEKTTLKASYLSILAHLILFITMFGFTPLKATELGANGLQLTFLVICFMLPHALAPIVATAYLNKKLGYSLTAKLAFILSGATTLAIAFAPSMPYLYVTQAINGFSIGILLPIFLVLAIKDVKQEIKATAMGLYQSIYSIGMFSGPFIAGYINDYFNVNGGFIFGASCALIAIISLQFFSIGKKETRSYENEQ